MADIISGSDGQLNIGPQIQPLCIRILNQYFASSRLTLHNLLAIQEIKGAIETIWEELFFCEIMDFL